MPMFINVNNVCLANVRGNGIHVHIIILKTSFLKIVSSLNVYRSSRVTVNNDK